MSVCSLQLAAAHSLIIAAYKKKKVFELLSKAAFKIALHGPDHIWTKKVLQPADSSIIELVDKIPNVNHLPYALKARVAVIAFELGRQCIHFFEDISYNMLPTCEVDILLCGRNIFITQNFNIDRKKTILTLLEKSKMSVKFKPNFLMTECIEKHDIEIVAGRVLTVEARKRKTRRYDKSYKGIKKQINEALKTYNSDTIKMFIEKRFSSTIGHSWLKMLTYFVTDSADSELEPLMKYHFDTLELEEKRQTALEAINFMLEETMDIDWDVLMYLGDFLDECDWSALVDQHSLRLIKAFLPSWRYRYLCVEWFKMAVGKYDIEIYRDFITDNLPVYKTWGEYETFELKQILRNIWYATPKEFKEDAIVQGVIEQFVILIWGDCDLFISMIRDLDREKQKDLLASAALLAIGTHKQIVPLLMNRIRELGFDYTWNEEVVSISTFLIYICRKNIVCRETETYHKVFDEIGKFYFTHSTGADMFKEFILINNPETLELFLLYRWSSNILGEFINWLHNGSTVRVKRFVCEMLSTGVIQRTYEKILTHTGKTKTAGEGLRLLKIQDAKRISIKRAALLKPQVRKGIMIRQFKREEFTLHSFEKQWSLLLKDFKKKYVKESLKSLDLSPDDKSTNHDSMDQSSDQDSMHQSSNHDSVDQSSDHWYHMYERRYHEEWRQKFFEELLVSEECLEALIYIIVHVEKEASITKYQNRLEQYDAILGLFKEYKLSSKIEKLLEKHGHPNLSDTLFYGNQEASGVHLPLVRKVVDFSYRYLRAKLRKHDGWGHWDYSSDDEELDEHSNIDLTELSIKKADSVNLKIPVVI